MKYLVRNLAIGVLLAPCLISCSARNDSEERGIHIDDDIVFMTLGRNVVSELMAESRGTNIPFQEWDDLIRVLKTSRLDNTSNDSEPVGEIQIVYEDAVTLEVQVLPEDNMILFKVGDSFYRPVDSDLSWFNQFVERVERFEGGHY